MFPRYTPIPTASNPSTLPLELQHSILQFLRPWNHAFLSEMSKVSRFWRRLSHEVLFATVHLRQTNVIPFYRLVQNPFSHDGIMGLIREIRLETVEAPTGWHPTQVLALNCLLTVLSRSDRLGVVYIANPPSARLAAELTNVIRLPFLGAHTLKLYHIFFRQPFVFDSFFRCFPNLQQLEMTNVGCAWHLDPNLPPSTIPEGIYALHLFFSSRPKESKVSVIWKAVSTRRAFSSPHLVELCRVTQLGPKAAIHRLAPILRRLEVLVDMDQASSTENIEEEMDISPLRVIESMVIGSSTRVLSMMAWLPRVLRELGNAETPSLKSLEIRFASSRQFHLDKPVMRSLSQTLLGPQYANLEDLHFVAYSYINDEEVVWSVTGALEESFQEWAGRNVVRVSFTHGELPEVESEYDKGLVFT